MHSLREAASLSRNPGLDTLRAIAIILVVFCHSLLTIPAFPGSHTLFYLTGFLGVEIFFVLSGYLIGSILLRDFQTPVSEGRWLPPILNFWRRRWYRTLPNYFLFLGVNFAVFGLSSQLIFPDNWPAFFIFCQKIAKPSTPRVPEADLMPESWSLAVEEWFYLLIPVLITIALALTRRSFASYLFAIATLMGGSLLLRCHAASTHEFNTYDLRIYTLLRLDAIAYGAMAAALMKRWQLKRHQIPLLLLGILGIFTSLYLYAQTLNGGLHPLIIANIFTLNSLSIACLLPFTIYSSAGLGYSKVRHTITWISILSYAMYLVHYALSLQIVWRVFPESSVIVKMSVYTGSCVVIATLVYEFYERPMTKLRDRSS